MFNGYIESHTCPECDTLFIREDQFMCEECGWTETNDLTCNTCAADVDLCECEEKK